MSNLVAPIRREASRSGIGCGGCKATGVEHKWDNKGNLLPTGNPCPTCNGTGVKK